MQKYKTEFHSPPSGQFYRARAKFMTLCFCRGTPNVHTYLCNNFSWKNLSYIILLSYKTAHTLTSNFCIFSSKIANSLVLQANVAVFQECHELPKG